MTKRYSRLVLAALLALCVLFALAQNCAAQTLTPPEAEATRDMAIQQAKTISRMATANAPTRTAVPTPEPTATPLPTRTPVPTMTATDTPEPTRTQQPITTMTSEPMMTATQTLQRTISEPTAQPTSTDTLGLMMVGGVIVLLGVAFVLLRWLGK